MCLILLHSTNPLLLRALKAALGEEYIVQMIADEQWLHITLTTSQPLALFIDGALDQVTARCRRARALTGIPLLGIAVRRSPIERVHFLRAGADDAISRPLDRDDLRARLRAKVRRATYHMAATTAPMPNRVQARRVGVPYLPLSPIETQLLAMLQKSPGSFVPSLVLQQAVWEDETHPGRLHYHMHHLRSQLATLSCEARIEMRRGVGYRLVQ